MESMRYETDVLIAIAVVAVCKTLDDEGGKERKKSAVGQRDELILGLAAYRA